MIGRLVRAISSLVASMLLPLVVISIDGQATAQEALDSEEQPFYYCYDYQMFLGRLDRDSAGACSELEDFTASYEARDRRQYLEDFEALFSETNALTRLAGALAVQLDGDLVSSFTDLDAADRVLYGAFQRNNDQGRATVYAVFMSSAKADLLRQVCREDGGANRCPDVVGFMTAAEMLGDSRSILDTVSPFDVLYCLLRVDAHTGPIGDVLSSRRFNLCVVENL